MTEHVIDPIPDGTCEQPFTTEGQSTPPDNVGDNNGGEKPPDEGTGTSVEDDDPPSKPSEDFNPRRPAADTRRIKGWGKLFNKAFNPNKGSEVFQRLDNTVIHANGTVIIGQQTQHAPPSASFSPQPQDPGFLPSIDSDEHEQVYVEPVCYGIAWQLLQRNQTLVIVGCSGQGRHALAHALALRQARIPIPEAEATKSADSTAEGSTPKLLTYEIRQLTSAQTLLSMSEMDFSNIKSHRIYLLDAISTAGSKRLDQHTLQELVGRVTQKGSFLIVTASDEHWLTLKVPWRIQLTSQVLPAAHAVFSRHLNYVIKCCATDEHGSGYTTLVEQLLTATELRPVLDGAPDIRRIARLAQQIGPLVIQDQTVEQLVATCKSTQIGWLNACAQEWMAQAPSLANLCLLVAAATLSETNVDDFMVLANTLRAKLNPHFTADDRQIWQQFQSAPVTYWLAATRMQLSTRREWQGDRRVTVDMIGLVPRELSLYLTDAFWVMYPQYHSLFCAWLCELGANEDLSPAVQLAIARTVGVLVLRAPTVIDHEIIYPWLNSGHYIVQEMAAMSLWFASLQEKTTARSIINRLTSWNQDPEVRARLIFASALIFAWLGIEEPEMFIKGMHDLVNGRNAWVLEVHGQTALLSDRQRPAVRLAFWRALQMNSFSGSDYVALFAEMQEWSKPTKTLTRRIAHSVFLDMMLATFPPDDEASNSDDPPLAWPVLLKILAQHAPVSRAAAKLYLSAAGTADGFHSSRDGIRQLVTFASNHHAARTPLKQFLRDIFSTDPCHRSAQSLQKTLTAWARESYELNHSSGSTVRRHNRQPPPPYSQQLIRWLRDEGLLCRKAVSF